MRTDLGEAAERVGWRKLPVTEIRQRDSICESGAGGGCRYTICQMMHIAYIGLGSNLGDRRTTIMAAVAALRECQGVLDVRLSSLHETEPVGGPPGQAKYLNAAARVETTLDAAGLLRVMMGVEDALGRQRQRNWGPRTIDLDLLLFDDQVIDTPELTVPHPRMHERLFVLAPLAEVGGDVNHPVLGRTIEQLLRFRLECILKP